MLKVKFKGNAPSGFDGYGRVEDIGEKMLENFQKTGMYDIEVIEEAPKPKPKPKKAKKAKKDKGAE